MERWRIFGLTTLLAIVFLLGLFMVAEAGRTRLRDVSQEMQDSMFRRMLVGTLRAEVAEAALSYQSFLATGHVQYLAPLQSAGAHIDETAESLVTAYRDEPKIAQTVQQLRYLAGMQNGAMMSAIKLYNAQGLEAAVALARAQAPADDPAQQFLAIAEQFGHYEAARMREARANYQSEVALVRQLALVGTLVNILLVASATLMALATLRRHRAAMDQVAQRKDELELEARERAAELNEVYAHLQTVQEQERSRLARGLHDELGGMLLAARMDVTWIRQHAREAEPTALQARLQRVLDVLDQGIDLKRRVIEELRPTLLDNMGLVAAIRWQVDETCGRAGLECRCLFPPDEPPVAPRTGIALFRVVQEALTNVQKHANARRVEVTLETVGDHLLLAIVDDGRGIDAGGPDKLQTHGLAGMKHRVSAIGGTLTVGPSPEGGTEVRAIVPRYPQDPGAMDRAIVANRPSPDSNTSDPITPRDEASPSQALTGLRHYGTPPSPTR